ncbi:hypothetical protein QE152_g30228 [Popillia japonica]|uniref:Uncharacterized protein n=1 Tax=Popillia japonica TaxID=7064 RepID=A0AAW1JF86_POPJA
MGKIEKENASLKQEIGELRNQIQDLEQHSKLNNLEIQGVPQKDILDILHKIGDAIQCNISPTDINAAHRVAQLNSNSSRPRNIIVSLVSRRKRDEILAAAKMTRYRSRSNLKSFGLNHKLPQVAEQLFINEHLTSAKKSLLYKAR